LALGAGLGLPGTNDSIQTLHGTFQALSHHHFFVKKEVIYSYTHLIPQNQQQREM
jgi:hypothetical protein